MNKLNSEESIKERIEELKIRRNRDLEEIKAGLMEIRERVKPGNMIRNALDEITHNDDLKSNIGNAAIGLMTGYVTKKVLFRNSGNPLKKLLGVAVQTFITGVAANNSDKIKDKGRDVLRFIWNKIEAFRAKKREADEYPVNPS